MKTETPIFTTPGMKTQQPRVTREGQVTNKVLNRVSGEVVRALVPIKVRKVQYPRLSKNSHNTLRRTTKRVVASRPRT